MAETKAADPDYAGLLFPGREVAALADMAAWPRKRDRVGAVDGTFAPAFLSIDCR